MTVNAKPPSMTELESVLGSALAVWNGIIGHAEATHAPLVQAWKPSKTEFGWMSLLQHKKRTLLYLTPGKGQVIVAIVLGERAFQLAIASSLPDAIKQLLHEAKPYAEGRGIRFTINSMDQLPTVVKLLEIKTTPS